MSQRAIAESPDELDPPWILHALVASALGGLAVVGGLLFVGGAGSDPLSLALVTATTVIAPLGIAALRRSGTSWDRALAIAAIAQPMAAACAVIALVQPAGRTAGLWSCAWMAFALFAATVGVARIAAARSRGPAELCAAAALVYLPVGAGWLVLSRMGLRPLGFSSIIVALTAIHFHFAAFAAPILAGRVIGALDGRARRVASIAGLALVVAQPIVAAGITVSPPLALAGAALLASALLTLSVLTVARARLALRSRAARALLVTSAAVPFVSMPLAIAWSVADAGGPRLVGLDEMVRWHGTGNAYGFALLGLGAWVVERVRAR